MANRKRRKAKIQKRATISKGRAMVEKLVLKQAKNGRYMYGGKFISNTSAEKLISGGAKVTK